MLVDSSCVVKIKALKILIYVYIVGVEISRFFFHIFLMVCG